MAKLSDYTLNNVLNKSQLAKDGSEAATGALPMGNNAITGLADPTNAQDAATKAWVQANSGFEPLGTGQTLTFHQGTVGSFTTVINLSGPVELLSLFVLGYRASVTLTVDGVTIFDTNDFDSTIMGTNINNNQIGGLSFGPVYAASSLVVDVNSDAVTMYKGITR